MGAEVSERYFDEGLQAWVTVCRPGSAKGILTVEGFRGAKASGYRAAKSASAAKGWQGAAKRARKKRSK